MLKRIFVVLFLLAAASVTLACEKNFKVVHDNGLYIVKVNYESTNIYPYVSEGLETVDKIAKKTNAKVAINTGFFDAKNKKTVSYITSGDDILANPRENTNLTSNPKLQPYLEQIFDRGELRFYDCAGKKKADIVYHNSEIPQDCVLISSTQAGPVILPDMDLEKEFFVIKRDGKIIRDGAGLTRRTDRAMTAIKGKYIYFIINDEKTPLTIYELREKIKKYSFDKAMGFDGGGSVSLFVKTKDGVFYQDREEKGASRAVKSALIAE